MMRSAFFTSVFRLLDQARITEKKLSQLIIIKPMTIGITNLSIFFSSNKRPSKQQLTFKQQKF